MRNINKLIRSGIQSSNVLGGLSLLQCYITVEELLTTLPQEHLLLDRFSANYERSVNKERLSKIENYFVKSVLENAPFDSPKIAVFVFGNPRDEVVHNKLTTLHYDQNKSAIIEGFLPISALCNLLDRVDPFTGKKAHKNRLSDLQKQKLAEIDVRLSIYYGRDRHVNEKVISKLFFDINSIDTKVYSPYIATHNQESPLNLGAEKLTLALKLEAIGGVSELNKITKSDSFVTTKSTLIHILLASLGGKGARVDKQLPTHLPNKTLITDQIIDDALDTVIPLMSGWLSCLESEFKQDSSGFHRSMQIWQALGIVAYHLMHHAYLTESELFVAGKTLGQLDYSKSASHWENCEAFKKDASDKFWINATGGGRTLRDKVAEYFISVLES